MLNTVPTQKVLQLQYEKMSTLSLKRRGSHMKSRLITRDYVEVNNWKSNEMIFYVDG